MTFYEKGLLLLLLFVFTKIFAGDAERATIRNLLRFYYVAQINDENHTPVLLDNAGIQGGAFNGPFWSNPNMTGPQRLVRALLMPPGAGGDENLQSIAARILTIINRPVKVNLLDDAASSVTAISQRLYGACPGNNGKAWPCASNMSASDDMDADCARRLGQVAPLRQDIRWAGNICFGTVYFNGSDMAQKFSTILHELVHTQDYSDGRSHLFWVNTTLYRYGADGDHYGTEAIPNMAMTYKEGIANAIRLMYDENKLMHMFQWFAQNQYLMVERALHAPGTGPSGSLHPCVVATSPSPDVWLYNQLSSAGVQPEGHTTDGRYGLFRLRSLPSRFVAHNEYILAMIGSEYARHVGKSKFFEAINAVNSSLRRASGSGVAILFRSLCYQALSNGQTPQTLLASPTAGGRMPYLFPLALADYFTGYRARSADEFHAIFEEQGFMREWVDLYWAQGRERVRRAVPLTNPQLGDITTIAMTLGINSSTGD